MNNAKINTVLMPSGKMRTIHQKYGLWICQFYRNSVSPGKDIRETPLRTFDFYDLSHLIGGSGWYQVPGKSALDIQLGDGVMVTPGFVHKYAGKLNDNYVEDAISFSGPVADALFATGVIKNTILKIGRVRRLLPIIELAMDSSDDSQLKANLALQNLLLELYFENKGNSSSPINVFLDQLLAEIRKRPERWWTIDAMSEMCNISPTHFNRLFKDKTGMTPKNYIDNYKMQIVVEQLANHKTPIRIIAEQIGYGDPFHFSRRFKQLKGCSPEKYRESSTRN